MNLCDTIVIVRCPACGDILGPEYMKYNDEFEEEYTEYWRCDCGAEFWVSVGSSEIRTNSS